MFKSNPWGKSPMSKDLLSWIYGMEQKEMKKQTNEETKSSLRSSKCFETILLWHALKIKHKSNPRSGKCFKLVCIETL